MAERKNEENDSLIRERKCPSCGSNLDNFMLEGKQIPFDPIGAFTIKQSDKVGLLPIWTFGRQHVDDIIFICCQSICNNCGLISSWHIPFDEFFAMTKSDKYNFLSLYSKQSLEKIIASNEVHDAYKSVAEGILKMLEKK